MRAFSRRWSLDKVICSSASWAISSVTAAGASYISRDLMPTSRSSTMSTLPTPCSPASSFSASTSEAAPISFPSSDTGRPASNPISTWAAASGASAGDTVHS